MSAQIPFTAYIKVVPQRGRAQSTSGQVVRRAGRFDYYRSLQKLARLVYLELEADVQTDNCGITLAKPGGGQAWMSGQFQNMDWGTACIPQFGNKPSLLMIEGFYCATDGDPSSQPYPSKPIIQGNEMMQAPGGSWPWLPAGLPYAEVEEEVKVLKRTIENSISDVSDDSGDNLSLYKLTYKGIVWGEGGHHFPR
jgi:hypothetical protein